MCNISEYMQVVPICPSIYQISIYLFIAGVRFFPFIQSLTRGKLKFYDLWEKE